MDAERAGFDVAGTPLGGPNPPWFCGEIGTLFGQRRDVALRMVDALADAAAETFVLAPGCPVALKGEILHRADVCLDDNTVQRYRGRGGEERVERYRDLIERKVVPLDDYAAILLTPVTAGCRGSRPSTTSRVPGSPASAAATWWWPATCPPTAC